MLIWIARRGYYLVGIVWAVGLGAYAAILFKKVDVGGDALRISMGVIYVLMGAALALLTARVSDFLSDRRTVRRKLINALARINLLADAYGEFARLADELQTTIRKDKSIPPVIPILGEAMRIAGMAKDRPD